MGRLAAPGSKGSEGKVLRMPERKGVTAISKEVLAVRGIARQGPMER